jgi:hypothetical protein
MIYFKGDGAAAPVLRGECFGGLAVPRPVVLLTHPGLGGCREHRRLLKRLKEMA